MAIWRRVASVSLFFLLTGCLEPGRECLAPANPGGGWDLTCRAVARVVREEGILAGSLRVRNLPGAGGGIAFAHIAADRRGDAGVLVAASPATTLRLAQGQFGDLSAEDVRWLGAIATDYGVVAVRADAPWNDLESLLSEWRAAPGSIVAAGGSAVGGQDHMKLLLLARETGIDVRSLRYVPFDGGGEALTALLGGFVAVISGDASELVEHAELGSIRLLAMLSPERLEGRFAEVPTAREFGHAVDWPTWRGFYVPRDLEDAEYEAWIDALRSMQATTEWKRVLERRGLTDFSLLGREFEIFVGEQIVRFREMSDSLELRR